MLLTFTVNIAHCDAFIWLTWACTLGVRATVAPEAVSQVWRPPYQSEIWYGGAILISEIVRGLENSVSVGLTGIKYSVIVMYIYCLELLTLKNSLNDVWHGCPRECQAAVLDAE